MTQGRRREEGEEGEEESSHKDTKTLKKSGRRPA